MIVEVNNATARNALKVSRSQLANLEVWVRDEARMYKPIKCGVGSGIWTAATSGTLTATTSVTAGTTVTAGTGITSTLGNITAAAGNVAATLGAVSAGTTVTAGTAVVATTTVTTPKVNGYPVNTAVLVLTETATIATDAVANNTFRVTLTATRILGNPTNLVLGGWYEWEVIQGGTGSYELTYGNLFVHAGGVPTLTNTVGAKDVLRYRYNGTHLVGHALLDVKA